VGIRRARAQLGLAVQTPGLVHGRCPVCTTVACTPAVPVHTRRARARAEC